MILLLLHLDSECKSTSILSKVMACPSLDCYNEAFQGSNPLHTLLTCSEAPCPVLALAHRSRGLCGPKPCWLANLVAMRSFHPQHLLLLGLHPEGPHSQPQLHALRDLLQGKGPFCECFVHS